MTPTGRLEDRITTRTTTMREILGSLDAPRELTDDNRVELRHLEESNTADSDQLAQLKRVYPDGVTTTATAEPDSAFEELRHKATLTNFMTAAVAGRSLSGAESELHAELRCDAGHIPTALLDGPTELRHEEQRADALTVAPTADAGLALQPIRPFLYAPSVAGPLSVDMPSVMAGTHGEPRITSALSAAFHNGSTDPEATAAVITVTTTVPHQITADSDGASRTVSSPEPIRGRPRCEPTCRTRSRMRSTWCCCRRRQAPATPRASCPSSPRPPTRPPPTRASTITSRT